MDKTMLNRFSEQDIPYEKLASLGLDKEKTLSMPKDVLQTLMRGEVTPLMQMQIRSRNGLQYQVPLKMQLVQDHNGSIELITYPVRKSMVYDLALQTQEKDRLSKGEVVKKEIIENGTRKMQFLQIDKETNSLIKRDVSSLRMTEQMAQLEKINDIQLGTTQKEAIKEGRAVELDVGHEKVTVGADLREPQGFKLIKGDMKEWDRQQKIKYDLTHEGFMGYVLTDKNRWEYQQVVDKLQLKTPQHIQKEQKMSTSMRR